MKNILKGSILLMVILIIGCGSADKNKVDNFLDDYEKVVVKWEEKIADGEFSEADSDEMNKILMDMEEDIKELQNVDKWNVKQQERYAKLSERTMDAVFKSMNIPGEFSY